MCTQPPRVLQWVEVGRPQQLIDRTIGNSTPQLFILRLDQLGPLGDNCLCGRSYSFQALEADAVQDTWASTAQGV